MQFTVLTPTYNRAHTLSRLYESLRVQTCTDFEWVIVDDGGDDGTAGLVSSWKADFLIRYARQQHGGLHRALNRGVSLSRGEWIAQVDDDDFLVPHALETFSRELPKLLTNCANVVALCYEADGQTVLGEPFAAERFDVLGVSGTLALAGNVDRFGILRADIAREFPFPDFNGEEFIVPGVVFNRIHARYPTRYVNLPLKIVTYAPGHMSSMDMRWASPRGAVVYHGELALSDAALKTRTKAAINALRFLLVVVLRWFTQVPTSHKLWSNPRGAALYYRELILAKGLSLGERVYALANACRFSLIAGVKIMLRG